MERLLADGVDVVVFAGVAPSQNHPQLHEKGDVAPSDSGRGQLGQPLSRNPP